MPDFTNKPYSEWVESSITSLFGMDPENIMFAARFNDGTTATTYFNCGNLDRMIFVKAIFEDGLIELIKENRDIISDILDGNDDD